MGKCDWRERSILNRKHKPGTYNIYCRNIIIIY